MTLIEISLLLVGLSLVSCVVVQAVYTDFAFGQRYGASVRDEERSTALSKRLARVVRKQVEGVALFLPLVILADGGVQAPATPKRCPRFAWSMPPPA